MGRRIYLVGLYVVTLVCMIIGICGNVFNMEPFCNITSGSLGKHIETSCDYDNISAISVDMSVGGVVLCKGDTFKVSFSGAEKLLPDITSEKGTLYIKQSSKRVNNFSSNDCSIKITVPDKVVLDFINISVDMGEIKADNIASKSAVFEVDMGEIKLNACNSDEITLSVDMGSIELDGIDIDLYNVTMEAGLGDVEIYNSTYHTYTNEKETSKTIKAEVGMGNIQVEK